MAALAAHAEPERDDPGTPRFANAPHHTPWAASTPRADPIRDWHADDLAEAVATLLHDAADLRGVDR